MEVGCYPIRRLLCLCTKPTIEYDIMYRDTIWNVKATDVPELYAKFGSKEFIIADFTRRRSCK